MHRQCVEYMRGVNITDQLRGNYSSQLRCHKWWVKIFHLIVDQTKVNAYVTWVKQMEDLGLPVTSHLAFKIAVGKYLASDAIQARQRRHAPPERRSRHPHPVHTLFPVQTKAQLCDLRPSAEVVLHFLWRQMDVPGIMLPGTTGEAGVRGMIVGHM